jgi:photosystem II stability/assembly factor-like uncharacterized protein
MRLLSRLAQGAFGLALLSVIVVNVGSADAAASAAQGIDLDALFANVQYREVGPTRQGGRFSDIAVDPRDTDTFYAATASGGLWKTRDGVHYESIFHVDDVFSIGEVTVAPSAPDTVWVGTGEANNSRSSYWGNGIYKSTDAGETWAHMGLPDSGHIGRIVVHPSNPDIVYVAALGHLYKDNPERGLYKTTNGGQSWELVLTNVIEPTGRLENETTRHIGVVDVTMHPTDPDTLYAATYDKVRRPWTFNPGGPGSRIYKSTDAGASWTMLEGGLPMGMLGRIGVAVTPAAPDNVYAVIEDVNVDGASEDEVYQALLNGAPGPGRARNDRIWRSTDGGASWEAVSPPDQNVGGGPPYYYGQIIVDPNDADKLFMLSARSLKSIDGGREWIGAWSGIGGDDHTLWIDPNDSQYMLMGYDHGFGISRDGGETWYHPDNMPLAQFYAVGIDMAYPYNVYGGLQDNGSKRGPSRVRSGGAIPYEAWERVGGGDGMYNEVDWSNNRYLYNESQFGPLRRLDMLTNESRSIRYSRADGEEELRWNWNAPIAVSRHDNDVIYHGANVVLRSAFRGETWEEISPDLTTNDPAKIQGIGNIQYCTIVALDESSLVAGLLWAGTDDGNVWVTKDSGETWTQVNGNITGNPGYWVSRVEPSHHDPATAYVTFTGYRRDDFRPFIYKTTDYGETWTDISSNLPNAPIDVVREDHKNPNLLFVGNEIGVWVSIDGGGSWHRMKGDMPTVPVYDMKLHPRENDLVAGTHGRGIFITDISWIQELTEESLARPVHLFGVETAVRWRDTSRNDRSAQNFEGGAAPDGSVINYMLASPAASAPTIRIYDGARLVRELTGTNEAGLNTVVWDMDFGRRRTEAEMGARGGGGRGGGGRGGFGGRGGGDDPNRRPDEVYSPAPEGTYRVVLVVDGEQLETTAQVLEDHWWDKQF